MTLEAKFRCNLWSGNSEACQELLTAGADTEAADVEGLTRKLNILFNNNDSNYIVIIIIIIIN